MTDNDCCRPDRGPVDPGYGVELPPVVDNGLPGDRPPHASTGPVRPTYPVDPDYGLPKPPHVWPQPPALGHPEHPIALPPLTPTHPIYVPPPEVNNDLPGGAVWPPLHEGMPEKVVALVWIPGVGYRWVVLNASVSLPIAKPKPPHASTQPLPGERPKPSQPIAPTPE